MIAGIKKEGWEQSQTPTLSVKKENKRIERNTREFNASHKKECSYFNWVARLTAYLDLGKKIYPEPSPKEVEAFKQITGHKDRRGNKW